MKRVFAVVIMLLTVATLASADYSLKAKQKIGKDQILYFFVFEPSWDGELMYGTGSKPWFQLSVGPAFALKKESWQLKALSFFGFKCDASKKNWAIENLEADIFLIPTYKSWTVSLRGLVRSDPRLLHPKADKRSQAAATMFWGREFVGYKLTEALELRLQTEWTCKEEFTQDMGLGWELKLPHNLALAGYVAAATKKPYTKAGWLELGYKLKRE